MRKHKSGVFCIISDYLLWPSCSHRQREGGETYSQAPDLDTVTEEDASAENEARRAANKQKEAAPIAETQEAPNVVSITGGDCPHYVISVINLTVQSQCTNYNIYRFVNLTTNQ